MKTERAALFLFVFATLVLPGGVTATDQNVIAQIQHTLDDYLAQRHEIEGSPPSTCTSILVTPGR